MKSILLLESSDPDVMYGTLQVSDCVQLSEVQEEINRIKSELSDDWSVEDIVERFPEWWEATYDSAVNQVLI